MQLHTELKQQAKEKVEDLKNLLASGGASDYSHYRELVGTIQGIELGIDLVLDTIRKRTDYEDDD
jgi:hypothetical protein